MAIPRDKSRIILTLQDYTKSCIEYLSETDKRTPSKEIEFIIDEYIKLHCKEDEELEEDLNNYYHNTYKPKEICNKILSYWKQSIGSYKDNITFSEASMSFEASLLNDPYLQKEFTTFNGEENVVLNHLDKMIFDLNFDLESSNYIQSIIPKLFC